MRTTKQELIDAKALIANPENWTQGAMVRNDKGRQVFIQDPNGCKFCALGAMEKSNATSEAYLQLADVAFNAGFSSIAALNDLGVHEQVMKAFDKAIEAAS